MKALSLFHVFTFSRLTLAAVLVAGCREDAAHSAKKAAGPDVILITLDTIRPDRLGCYGYHRPTSPHIDDFAGHATRFTRATAPMPLTAPSHCTMMTGRYPGAHGVVENAWFLSRRVDVLPEILRRAGYQTASVTAVKFLAGYGLERGFTWVDDEFGHRYERRADHVSRRAMEWLDRAEPGKPLFLWAHYYDPHHPYRPPRRFLPLVKDPREAQVDWPALQRQLQEELRQVPGRALQFLLSQYAYDGEIQFMDEQVGVLLDHLKQAARYDDALVIVVGDHGEGFGEHPGDVLHGEWLYETTVHVPLLVKLPGQTAGRVADSEISLVDLMPTLMDTLSLPVPEECQGMSLVPLLQGEPVPWDEAKRLVFMERRRYQRAGPAADAPAADTRAASQPTPPAEPATLPADDGGRPFDTEMYAVRQGPWKLIWNSEGPPELYDLDADPGERLNLTRTQPGLVEHLTAELEAWRERTRRIGIEAVPPSERDTIEMLKALGYVHGASD